MWKKDVSFWRKISEIWLSQANGHPNTIKFEIYPASSSPFSIPHKLAVPPFIELPTISTKGNDFTDHDYAVTCLQQNLSRSELNLKHWKLAAILFDFLQRMTANTILQQAFGPEVEEEMQGIFKKDNPIPP